MIDGKALTSAHDRAMAHVGARLTSITHSAQALPCTTAGSTSYRLVSVAAVALVLGLAFYVFTAARFDLRQLVTGYGDHWLVGSAPNPPLWPLM